MFNTIILKRGCARLTEKEYEKFNKGDTIFGDNSNPGEIRHWSIDQKEEAKKELAKYKCTYDFGGAGNLWNIEEYALEYCECNNDGEFMEGLDFDLAKVNDPQSEDYLLAKKIFDCLSDGYDDEELREESETDLFNELSQLDDDSDIKIAILRLCETIEDLEG